MMTFTLEPKDLSPNATRVTLNLDGQSLVYFNSATRAAADDLARQGRHRRHHPGLPADRRLARGDGQRDRQLGLAAHAARRPPAGRPTCPSSSACASPPAGYYADFELRANSVDNPFDLQMFSRFTCPDRI